MMGQIEHHRNVCRDLEVKLAKHIELRDEAMERKCAVRDEIDEIEVRIAAAEAQVSPDPPQCPAPTCLPIYPLILQRKWRWTKKWMMVMAPKSLEQVLAPS